MPWSDAARQAAAEARRRNKGKNVLSNDQLARKAKRIEAMHRAEARRRANNFIDPPKLHRSKGFKTTYGIAGVKIGSGGSY